MTGSIAQRLLWKEYRVQRSLWLALAIGTVVLHGLIRAMIDDPGEAAEVFYWMAAILAFCYAVGGAAITFATEREDGTHLRLMTLAPPPVLTLTVKLMLVVLATILLCAATGLSAWLVSWSGFREPKMIDDSMEWFLRFAMWLAAGITWGMLFSLLLRHVFTALLSGLVVSLVMMGFVSAIWEEHDRRFMTSPEVMTSQRFWEFVAINACILAGLVAVMGVNILLTRRWCHRMFLEDAPSRIRLWIGQTRVRRSSAEGGLTVEFGMQSDLSAPVLTPAEAVIQSSPRVSLSWLYHTQGSRSLRPFRFLRWKEIAETRLVFLLACGPVVLLSLFSASSHWTPNPLQFFLLIALPALAGVLTFSSEQRQDKFHFLANQGLSPRSIWLSKHSVWFPRAVGVVLLILATIAFVAPHNGGAAEVARSVYRVGYSDREWQARFSPLATDLLGENAVMRGMIITLAIYSVGQAASLVYRRGVVAVFATILGIMITMIWFAFCTVGGVPLVLTLLPIVPGLLCFTYLRTSSWLLNRNATRSWLVPGGILAGSVLTCVSLAMLYRVIEIPSVDSANAEFGLTADQRTQLVAPITAEERETADMYRQAVAKLSGQDPTTWSREYGDAGRWRSATEETRIWVESNAESLEIIRKAAARSSCAFKRVDQLDISGTDFNDTFWLILRAAIIETMEGDVEDALESLREAFVVARHAAGRGEDVSVWVGTHRRSQGVLTALEYWATRPEIDARLVERASRIIDEHRAAVPGTGVVIFGNYQHLRSIIAGGPETIREWASTPTDLGHHTTLGWVYRFPGELRRMRKIVDWTDYRLSQLISEFEAHGRGDARSGMGAAYRLLKSKEHEVELQLARWSKTTPSLRYLHADSFPHDAKIDIKLQTKAAATILTMQLLLAERRDGMLPESLDGIQVELKDPWTGKPFVWYPQGVPQKVKSGGYGTIPPDRPFLLSAGPDNARIERIEYEDVPVDAMGAGGMMESGMDGQGAAAPGFPTAIGGAPAQQQPADNPAPDNDADAPEVEVKTVVEYVIRQQHSGYGTGPSIFFIPRPEQDSQPE
jgi:hypothetical protein